MTNSEWARQLRDSDLKRDYDLWCNKVQDEPARRMFNAIVNEMHRRGLLPSKLSMIERLKARAVKQWADAKRMKDKGLQTLAHGNDMAAMAYEDAIQIVKDAGDVVSTETLYDCNGIVETKVAYASPRQHTHIFWDEWKDKQVTNLLYSYGLQQICLDTCLEMEDTVETHERIECIEKNMAYIAQQLYDQDVNRQRYVIAPKDFMVKDWQRRWGYKKVKHIIDHQDGRGIRDVEVTVLGRVCSSWELIDFMKHARGCTIVYKDC